MNSMLRTALAFAAALCTAPTAPAQEVDPARVGTIDGTIQVSPSWIRLPSGERFDTPNGIARALEFAAPGARIEVLAGKYPPLEIGLGNRNPNNSRTRGGAPGRPIVVRGRAGARLEHRGQGDTLAIAQKSPVAHIWFENLELVPGNRAAVMFYDLPDHEQHSGFHFYDCRILGSWDHVNAEGETSKWGVLGHDLDDFVFAGRERRAEVSRIRLEHAFYLQSPRGDIRIENVDASRLGRCFIQLTARERSGPPGRGLITVRGNRVEDTGLSDWDDHKGGSAFTFAGGLEFCTILVAGNRYRAGFDPSVAKLTRAGVPFGTGAFVAWHGGEARPNGKLVLTGNDFEIAPDAGDRALVTIGACEKVQIDGSNRFLAGAFGVALDLKGIHDGKRSDRDRNGPTELSRDVELRGRVLFEGRPLTDDRAQALAVPFGDR
jgi:hypothetical protein